MFLIYATNFLLAIGTTVGMTIMPLLITESLGFSLLVLGLMEGITEFISNLLRLGNGILFDKVKNKRLVFLFSTTLALASKVILLVPNLWTIFISKTLERSSNGAFAAPRDAYVAEAAHHRGRGLAMLSVSKSLGCVVGPLLVSGFSLAIGDVQTNMLLVIALLSMLLVPTLPMSLCLNIKTPLKAENFSLREVFATFQKIKGVLAISVLFFLGRFNDGMLLVHLKACGFPAWFYLANIGVFNFTMIIASPIFGREIDKGRLHRMLQFSILALLTFNICYFLLKDLNWPLAIAGLIAWGLQRTGAQIVFSSMVFKSVDESNFGTAIGVFYVVSGVAAMLAAFIAGAIGKHLGLNFIFLFSGVSAIAALWRSYRIT